MLDDAIVMLMVAPTVEPKIATPVTLFALSGTAPAIDKGVNAACSVVEVSTMTGEISISLST